MIEMFSGDNMISTVLFKVQYHHRPWSRNTYETDSKNKIEMKIKLIGKLVYVTK